MTIKIQKKGTNTEYDLAALGYLDEDNDVKIKNEHARTAFEVVYSDVRLSFSNADGYFSTLFSDVDAEWVIIITDSSNNFFGGEIEKSTIQFDAVAEKVSFDVFSTNKIFWERVKTTRINHSFDVDEKAVEYSTLLHLLQFNLHPTYTENFRDIFDTITVLDRSYDSARYDYSYVDRAIRWYKYADLYDIQSISVEDSRVHLGTTNHNITKGDTVVIWGVVGAECNWDGRAVNINGEHTVNDVYGESFTLLRVHIDVAGTGGQVIIVPRNTAGYIADLPFNDSLTGRYADLADDTTIEELLKALEIFYNAEFYVDFFDKALKMKRRQSPNETVAKSIQGLICDDEPVELNVQDKEKYDYLYTVTRAEEAPAPLATISEPAGYSSSAFNKIPGERIYYVSNVIDGKEVALSKPLKVSLVWKELDGKYYTKQLVTLTIPPGLAGTTARYIYSNVCGHEELGLYKRKEIAHNNMTTWEDLGGYTTKIPTWLTEPVAGWIAYDETAQEWSDVILDAFDGTNRPEGVKIFEVIPQLRFVNTITRASINSQTLFDVFCFFGKDTTLTNIKENWIPLFITKAVLKCMAKGTNYKDGDEITRPVYPYLDALTSKNFQVLCADVNLNTEETELEMVQL